MAGGGPIPVAGLLSLLFKLAGPLLTLVFPAAASFEALETRSPGDDKQWLTYWVLYSVLQVLELWGQAVLKWIPLYSTLKLVLVAWLVLPQTRGSAYLYSHFIQPHGQRLRKAAYEKVGDYSHFFKGPATVKAE